MPFDNIPPAPITRTDQIIDRAIELLERGWCQGRSTAAIHGLKAYCMIGAVNKASGEFESHRSDVIDVALKRLHQALPIRRGLINRVIGLFNPRAAMVMRIAAWNDNFRRTQDEVLALMHNARNMHNAI